MKLQLLFLTLLFLTLSIKLQHKGKSLAQIRKCVEQVCPGQFKTCKNDKTCASQLKECSSLCGTQVGSKPCWLQCAADTGNQAAIDTVNCATQHSCGKEHPTHN